MDTPTSETPKQNIIFLSGKIIQMLLCIGFFILHLIVVPIYMDFYNKMGAEVPSPTQLVYLITNFLRHQWLVALPLIACMFLMEGILIRKTQHAGYYKLKNAIPWLISIMLLFYIALGILAVYLPLRPCCEQISGT